MNAFSFLLLSSLVLCLSAKDRFLASSDFDARCDMGLDENGNQVIRTGLFGSGIPCDNKYYECKSDGSVYEQSCPGTDIFVSLYGGSCAPASMVDDCGKSVLPECNGGVDENGLQVIKTDAFSKGIPCDSHYYVCNSLGDEIFTMSCVPGTIFNGQGCDYRYNVEGCEGTLSVDPQCDIGVDANGKQLIRSGRFASSSCSKKYFECDPQTGALSTTTCEQGFAFDLSTKTCNKRELVAGCVPVCSGSYARGFEVPEDCRAKMVCADDNSLSFEWCPEGTFAGWGGNCNSGNEYTCNAPDVSCPKLPANGPASVSPYTYNLVANGEDCTDKDQNIAYALTSPVATLEGNDFFVCNGNNQAIHYYCCWGYSVVLEAAPICKKIE